jgi:hypothetical protein
MARMCESLSLSIYSSSLSIPGWMILLHSGFSFCLVQILMNELNAVME